MFETKDKEKPWNKYPDTMRVFAWKARRSTGQADKHQDDSSGEKQE